MNHAPPSGFLVTPVAMVSDGARCTHSVQEPYMRGEEGRGRREGGGERGCGGDVVVMWW